MVGKKKVEGGPEQARRSAEDQVAGFKEAARELECDDDEGRFRDRLKKLTKAPAPESVEPKKVAAAKPRRKRAYCPWTISMHCFAKMAKIPSEAGQVGS